MFFLLPISSRSQRVTYGSLVNDRRSKFDIIGFPGTSPVQSWQRLLGQFGRVIRGTFPQDTMGLCPICEQESRVVLFLIDHHTVPYVTNVYGFLTLTMLFFSPKPNVNLTTWQCGILHEEENTKCIRPSSCLSYRLFVTSPPEKQLLEAIVWSNLGGWPSSLFFLFRSFYQHPKCWTDANGEVNRLFQSHSQQSFSIWRTKRSGTRQSPQLLITEKQKSASSEESHSSSVQ